MPPAQLTLALPKGRLLDPALQLLSAMGIRGLEADTRRLLLTDPSRDLRFIFLKPADIPTYVEYGAADLGIVARISSPNSSPTSTSRSISGSASAGWSWRSRGSSGSATTRPSGPGSAWRPSTRR